MGSLPPSMGSLVPSPLTHSLSLALSLPCSLAPSLHPPLPCSRSPPPSLPLALSLAPPLAPSLPPSGSPFLGLSSFLPSSLLLPSLPLFHSFSRAPMCDRQSPPIASAAPLLSLPLGACAAHSHPEIERTRSGAGAAKQGSQPPLPTPPSPFLTQLLLPHERANTGDPPWRTLGHRHRRTSMDTGDPQCIVSIRRTQLLLPCAARARGGGDTGARRSEGAP